MIQMAREGLRYKLSAAIQQALSQDKPAVAEGLSVKQSGGYRTVNVTVRPLGAPVVPPGLLMVVFEELPPAQAARKKKAGEARSRLPPPSMPPDDPGRPTAISSAQLRLGATST